MIPGSQIIWSYSPYHLQLNQGSNLIFPEEFFPDILVFHL